MTDKQRAMATIAGGVVLAVIVWLLLRRSSPILNQAAQNIENVLDPVFEKPLYGGGTYDFGPINLGSIYLNAPPSIDNSCGCGCEVSPEYANRIELAANAYSDNLNNLQRLVAGAYLASIPTYVSQYFNDSVAAGQFQGSVAAFQGYAP